MALEDAVRFPDHVTQAGATSVSIQKGVEAAGQSWKRGAPLVNSGGSLAEAASPLTDAQVVVGFAVADATGVTGSVVDYMPADPQLEFEATLEDATNGDHALAAADLNSRHTMVKKAAGDNAGAWYVNENVTAAPAVYVTALVGNVGDVQGRVRCRLLATATQQGGD